MLIFIFMAITYVFTEHFLRQIVPYIFEVHQIRSAIFLLSLSS